MLALISLFVILFIVFIIITVGSVALELTGLSSEVANFQAISAFSGAGFTTQESESISTNQSRRNLIKTLIVLGNIGLTTSMATLILTFVGQDTAGAFTKLIILVPGLTLGAIIFMSSPVQLGLRTLIKKVLRKFSNQTIMDYNEVLGLGKGFSICKIHVGKDEWMLGKELKDLKLDREGTLILGIERKEKGKKIFYGAPNGKSKLELNDVVTCYGRPEAIRCLAERKKGYTGDAEHKKQIEETKEKAIIEEEEEGKLVEN